MPSPLFDITDGTTYVSLIAGSSRGLHIKEWQPTVNAIKGGGIFADNPIANSRQLVMRKWENAVETITLQVSSDNQDGVAQQLQSMFDMLEKATEYWTSEDQGEPVYLRVRGSTETNIRYALIHAYQVNTLNNPFATPLFACNPATIDGAVLTIERGHWLSVPPGDGDCVEIAAGMTEAFPLTHFNYPNADTDDGTIDQTAGTINTSNTYLRVGRDTSGNLNHAIMRFVTVNIPPGATITAAWITFEASNTQKPCSGSGQTLGSSCCYARFYGEDTDDAATFSTYANWAARSWTTAYRNWTIPGTFQSNLYNSPSLTAIIQEIIDRPGSADGNAIGIFLIGLGNTPTGVFRRFASFDHASYDRPQLTIKYITDTGQEATCDFYTAFVANKQSTNNLTHVYLDDGGAFGANLLNAVLPHQILPAVPVLNDAVYFGVQTGVTNQDSSTFNSLIFDIGTPSATMQGVWEYYNGAGWSTLTVYDTTTGLTSADLFQETGVQSVFWKIPYNMAETTVNAVTGWWVRARVTLGGGTGPTQQNRHIYTVSWPNVSIAADQVGGDIPALARIEVSTVAEDEAESLFDIHRVLMGSRSTSRGEGFTPFINLSDVQTIAAVNVSVAGGTTTFGDFPQASTGRVVSFSPVGATSLSPRVYIAFESASNVYKGRYRVFLRTTRDSAGGGGFEVALSYYSSTVGYALKTTKSIAVTGQSNPIGAAFWELLDFGLVTIPFGKQYFASGDGQNKTMIVIEVSSSAARTLYLHDLILFPCDEWYGEFIVPSIENFIDSGLGSFGATLAADSLFLPRKQLRAASGWMAVGENRFEFLSEVWRVNSAGEVSILPRAAQGLYFLSAGWFVNQYWLSTPEGGFSVRVHKAERWLGMRGAS